MHRVSIHSHPIQFITFLEDKVFLSADLSGKIFRVNMYQGFLSSRWSDDPILVSTQPLFLIFFFFLHFTKIKFYFFEVDRELLIYCPYP